MLTVRDEYSLRRFDYRSANSAAFDKAINIYQSTTGGRAKTDASQVVYWVERRPTEFSDAGDQVHVLGLLRGGTVVGFALCFYLPAEKLFVVDHMAVTPASRSMTAFERFCELIHRHAHDERLEVDYFVVEASTNINDADPLLNADTLIRLLQIKGLRTVDCQYQTPSPQKRPPYVPVRATLLLYSSTENRISSEKLLDIVACMHDGLYKNWYRIFATDFEAYCTHLREIESFVRRGIGNKEYVAIYGHPPSTPHVDIANEPQRLVTVVAFIALAAVLAVATAELISLLHIGLWSVIGGAIAVSICTVAVTALWYDNAVVILKYAIDALLKAAGKRK